jgi:hypothetical protein
MKNHELELARNFVENTSRNLFLTGRAGTGKTTFLRYIKEHSQKRLVVVAPTGVAAINAQGVTIHSFFQLPFGPILTQTSESNLIQSKFNKRKIDILRSLDLLIIDEISMVRADLLDGIDQILRRFNHRKKPFGGVQVLMIGDVQQLAPVVKQDEWHLISKFYETPFFFSSKAYNEAQVLTVELQKIYRQEDKKFIDLLEEVRNNQLTDKSLQILNERYQPQFIPHPDEGYITLTTHNNTAENINLKEMKKLQEKSYFFKATINGIFPEYAYPTFEELELKEGSQVMFIKNDSDAEKRYFNGKIGKIIELDEENIKVQCPDDPEPIEVKIEKWENYNYTINPVNQEIEEEVIGSFEQIPLKLAWAITIHKSQGLTFEKAIIDAQLSFAHGQTYVALSRCKTLEGMVLLSKINAHAVINDARVSTFSDDVRTHMPDENRLQEDMKRFQLDLLEELFDFKSLIFPLNALIGTFNKNSNTLIGQVLDPLRAVRDAIQDELQKTSTQFKVQLEQMSQQVANPEADSKIQERIVKAIQYYQKFLEDIIQPNRESLSYTTDNKEVKKEFEKFLDELDALIHLKKVCLNGLKDGFKSHTYLEYRAKAHLLNTEKTKPKKMAPFTNTKHQILFEELRDLRRELAEIEMVEMYQIFTQVSLYEICEKLPQNLSQLKKINGIGQVKLRKYGEAILDLVLAYCDRNDLQVDPTEEPEEEKPKKPKPVKGATNHISLELFKQGKTVSEIASERSLAITTIETHLASFVATGEIKVTDLISAEKYEKLLKVMTGIKYENLTDLRAQVGEEYTYGELRLITEDLKARANLE